MKYSKIILPTLTLVASLLNLGAAYAVTDLAQAPLLTLKTAPGLVMLTMGRDLQLSKAGYNDVNDLDGDGNPDFFFKPGFKYEGYFATDRCYTYTTSSTFSPANYGNVVIPNAADTSKNYYKCPGQWSGNYLNWLSMSRIDTLRKVLYGGKRSTDETTSTILERSYVPQDSTIWGKEYTSILNDGYDIADYTPLTEPEAGKRHMFANVTKLDGNSFYTVSSALNPPQLVIYQNRSNRIWDLVATERRILGTTPVGEAGGRTLYGPFTLRVETCKALGTPAKYEDFCTPYVDGTTTTYKPTGLLQRYGEKKSLAFGLLTGTSDKNYSGGVLRQNIDDFSQEVDAKTGVFTAVKGVVYHLSALRPWGFGNSSSEWDCGFKFETQRAEGACGMWGNPLGEMMYESLRYFSGALAGSTAYTTGVGTPASRVIDNGKTVQSPEPASKLDLQRPDWINPYLASTVRKQKTAYPACAKPIQMVIGDPKTSFDSDQLPGIDTNFGTYAGTFGSLNVSTEATNIWNDEASQTGSGISASKEFFIGQVGTNKDGNPSVKTVKTFADIRGHGPDATTNQGSFYGASVARYGKYTGLTNTAVTGTLRVDQISVALDSAVPQIKIPLNGKVISIIPFSKSIGGCSPMTATQHAKGSWQPTGEITSFFIAKVANTNTTNTDASVNGGRPYYAYNISYADNDQGSDNEKDAVVRYVIQQTASNQLSIGLEILSEATCMTMHQGYVISGTTEDGVYLDVGGNSGAKTKLGYFLDTPKNRTASSKYSESQGTGPLYTNIPAKLERSTIAEPRTFSSGTALGGFVPHDMLWYAAKYGSVAQSTAGAFTGYKLKPNGDPKNYYFASNPSALAAQIGDAFQNAASLSLLTATSAVSSGVKVSGGSLVYQASFDTTKWGGDLKASEVNADGTVKNDPKWKLTSMQPAPSARNVVLSLATDTDRTAKTSSINSTSYSTLGAAAVAFVDESTFKYLLGDRTNEAGGTGTGAFRARTSAVGDIINSDPLYIGQSNFGYAGTDYASFRAASKPNLIGVGSNDGFYRLVAADTGVEELAFIPKSIASEMPKLADPSYVHQYYVDGPSSFGHVKFSDEKWKAVVASSLGAGGKSIFAFNTSASNIDTTSNAFLWEFSGNTTGDGIYLGNVLNKPIIAQLNNAASEPAVIVGNGINSYNNKASLIILNAETGALIRTCTPTDAANTVENGMTSIAQVSYDNNGKVDLIYAGDYKGNIWRINPKTNSCGADAVKVFTAERTGKVQPITAEISIKKAPNSKSGYMVVFGTGKYSSVTDPADKDVQSLYGVWDENVTTPTAGTVNAVRTNLVAYSFGSYVAATNTRASTAQNDLSVNGGKTWIETTGKKGWMIDLTCSGCATGERFLDKPLLNGPIAYFLSHVPSDDSCQSAGSGWVTALDTNTGVFAKGFKDSDTSNSAFVSGAAPRGLFIITTTGSGDSPSQEYLDLSVNETTGNPTSNPNPGSTSSTGNDIFKDGGGKSCEGPDCIKLSQGNITQPPFKSRQVWRQIQ